jgi:hypothetical protein
MQVLFIDQAQSFLISVFTHNLLAWHAICGGVFEKLAMALRIRPRLSLSLVDSQVTTSMAHQHTTAVLKAQVYGEFWGTSAY